MSNQIEFIRIEIGLAHFGHSLNPIAGKQGPSSAAEPEFHLSCFEPQARSLREADFGSRYGKRNPDDNFAGGSRSILRK